MQAQNAGEEPFLMEAVSEITLRVIHTMDQYPPGLIGTVSSLFGRTVASSHGVDWTLDAMIAEQQCEFFRGFDGRLDRVWAAMRGKVPLGALTIEGPRTEKTPRSARLRFFILDESLRGCGLGRRMLAKAMQFCREKQYQRVYLTTLPKLDAALRLYREQGFTLLAETRGAFHGSRYAEQTFECWLKQQ
jgi:GNAT superfamily N-acetyltransferase